MSLQLIKLIREHVHHPATARELAQILRIQREERSSFKRQLKALVASGELLQVRGNRFGVPDRMDLVVARLSTNPGGFGFVVPEHAEASYAAGADAHLTKPITAPILLNAIGEALSAQSAESAAA